MKTKKTYGVTGLMEWHAVIPAGQAKVHVHFSGGALTGYGITPAEYTTDDRMIQAVIENSPYYKKGKIVLLRTFEVAEPDNGKKPSAKSKAVSSSEISAVQEEPALREVAVGDLDEAKDYLAEEYGVARSKMRSKQAIIDAGKENGLIFKGL